MPPAARGGGGSGAVRAGRAFVELFVQDNKLYRALDAAQARLKTFGAMSAKIGLAAGAGAASITAPMAKFFKDAVGRGAQIDLLAKRFGLTTESVSSLAYAFEKGGASLDDFEGMLGGLANKVAAAADANEELVDGLKGLNGRRLINLPIDQQLGEITDAFARIVNPIDRARVAQDLFGDSGLKLLEVLNRGSAGLADLKAEAAARGALVSQEDATRATEAQRSFNDVVLAGKLALAEIGKALVGGTDGVKSFGDQVIAVIGTVREWIGANRETVVMVAKVAAGVAAGGAALVAFGATQRRSVSSSGRW